MKPTIPVAAPSLVGNEKKYVLDCLESNWISSTGQYVERFESTFAEFFGVQHALSCSNGTVALHLALLALGIGPGDEVIVPTLTYIATANAVFYCGAKPVFVDSEPETWNLNPALLEECITPQTKAIIVVHLYGHPVDMDAVMIVAERHGLLVIEDAAEAHGAEYKGRRVGSIGHIATFSFYGNKIITTGEGGMVVTNDNALAAKVRQLKGQGMDLTRRYWFPIVGYNYRMTNVAAAIGLAQLEKIDWHIAQRRRIAAQYLDELKQVTEISFQPEKPWAKNVYWMSSIVLDSSIPRDSLMTTLLSEGIETRPFFYPLHTLPPYLKISKNKSFLVSEHLAAQGMNLPSSASLSQNEITFVCETIIRVLKSFKRP